MNARKPSHEGIHSSPFSFASLALSGEESAAAGALYDFSRAVRRDADLQHDAAAARLEHWRREVAAVYKGVCADPLMRAVLPAIKNHGLSRDHFERFLSAVEMDLGLRRYRTFDELKDYCDCAAGSLAYLVVEIIGLHDDADAKEHARSLGLGAELVRIVRDMGSDAIKGRIYLPLDDLDMFKYTVDELRAGTVTEGFLKLGRLMTIRARAAFDRSEKALRPGLRRRLVAPEIVRATCEELLRKVETHLDDCLLCASPAIKKWELVLIALTTWAEIKIAVFNK